MAANTWKYLPKTINDPETIEEHVSGELATHNADDSAHGQSDEAIYNHRIAEIIDHLDESITAGKLINFSLELYKFGLADNTALINWQSLDTFNQYGTSGSTTNLYPGYCQNITNLTGTGYRLIRTNLTHIIQTFVDASVVFITTFSAIEISAAGVEPEEFYVGIGNRDSDWIGWEYHDSKLYAKTYLSGVGHETEITGIACKNYHIYKIISYEEGLIEFYIDEILEHQESEYIPEGEPDPTYLEFRIDKTDNYYHELRIRNTMVSQIS